MVVGVVQVLQSPTSLSQQGLDTTGIDVHVMRVGPSFPMASGQSEAADGVEDAQSGPGPGHPGHLSQRAHRVGQVGKQPSSQYPGDAVVPHRQLPNIAHRANRYRLPP